MRKNHYTIVINFFIILLQKMYSVFKKNTGKYQLERPRLECQRYLHNIFTIAKITLH